MKNNMPIVKEINGQIVLEDPAALGMIEAIEAHNKSLIVNSYELNAERIEYFKNRIEEKDLSIDEYVVIVANVDDPNGGAIADMLMPGYDWQAIRDLGQVPFARGLTTKAFMIHALEYINPAAAEQLKEITNRKIAVVVDYKTAAIY